jgi:protocatechuate 3,4-dioxygenase beta subunit
MSRELQVLLDGEIMKLPEKYRTPFVLCCLEGKTKPEVSSELGWKEGTVSSRLARARSILARQLRKRGVELSVVLGSMALSQTISNAAIPHAFNLSTIQAALSYAQGGEILSPIVAGLVKEISGGIKMSLLKTTLAIIAAAGLVTGASAMVYLHFGPDQGKTAAPAKPAEPLGMGNVTGKVVLAAEGTPVSGAEVRLIRPSNNAEKRPTRRATTNAQGEFRFDGVAPGKYEILCFHGLLASRTKMYQGDRVVVDKNGDSKPVVLKMHPGVAVRVKVLCQATGKSLKGARVRLIWADIDRDHFTDDRGEVLLQPLTAESYHVEATAEDCAGEVRIVNLGNEQPAALEIKLAPGASVQGTVKDETGKPIAKVGINWYASVDWAQPRDYVETDAQGHYRLDNLPLSQNLQLFLGKLDYLSERKEFRLDSKPGSLTQLDLLMKRRPHGGSVLGVVTDREGKPIAGAELINQGGASNETRKAKTDAQGKFLLDNVYSDGIGHTLVAKTKGYAPRRMEFKPGPASKPAEVNVQLEPGHRIKGRVVNESGKPIAGAQVYFAHGNMHPGFDFGGSATTDEKGRFQFDSLPADTPFTVIADGYSQIPEIKLPLDGEQEVEVQMRSQGVIKGQVVDSATGKPVGRFTVRINSSEDRQPEEPSPGFLSTRVYPGEEFVSANGEFVLKDLLVGEPLQVMVLADGYGRQVVRRAVAQVASDGETLTIRMTALDPSKLLKVSGKLINHQGQPVRGGEVRLIVASNRPDPARPGPNNRVPRRDEYPFNWQMIESGQIDQMANVLQFQRQTTAADGKFLFERVPGGAEIELAYWGKGVPDGRLDHLEKMPAKERTNLTIKAPAPGRVVATIDKKVFGEYGSIQLSGSNKFYQATPSPDGKNFIFDDLPAGNYEVQIYSKPMRVEEHPGAFTQKVIGRVSVKVDEGKEEKVELGEADKAP